MTELPNDPLRFHPLFSDDLRDALTYYDTISPELADALRTAVNLRMDSIADFAESYPIAFDSFRAAALRRFPYFLLFRCEGAFIRLYALFHSASDPQRWRMRVDSGDPHLD